jgi:hypothetical protein
MVEFKTIKAEDIKFGRNSFIEIARKVAVTDEGENEFISISKGFFLPESEEKRFRKSISLPSDAEVLEKIAELLKSI